ncbi:hypothetical protein AMTRI_Chr10g5850 [Amborella trichopoda]
MYVAPFYIHLSHGLAVQIFKWPPCSSHILCFSQQVVRLLSLYTNTRFVPNEITTSFTRLQSSSSSLHSNSMAFFCNCSLYFFEAFVSPNII